MDEDIQQGVRLLADRAALWHDLEGLLRLDCPDSTDASTSCAGFDLVTEACSEVPEAIRILYAAGGKLDRGARFFLRNIPRP
ncbi:hypothetical protein F4824DRAFT_503429 [Ustulina deusta]|nr:hypothetical protein F4824DRAFT_503429 [Ustulina deusta]